MVLCIIHSGAPKILKSHHQPCVKVVLVHGKGTPSKKRPRAREIVIIMEYEKRFSMYSPRNNLQDWTAKAGLPDGCRLHGLGNTLGKLAAEGGATTRMSMELLTHSDINHAKIM